MQIIGQPDQPDSTVPDDLITEASDATFARDVLQASRQTPVVVDFWAPWCGPCKQLTPVLESVVRAARGAVKLVKINVDQSPSVAAQLGVQSIPAVFAFVGGRPVDGFMGVLPESQIKEFIAQLTKSSGEDPAADQLQAAEAALEAGAAADAAKLFGSVLAADPADVAAIAGLAKCHIATGEMDKAEQILATAPAAKAGSSEIAGARAALELALKSEEAGDEAELAARLKRDPTDHQARFDLALALNARGERAAALDHLIEIIRADREWDDEAARKQLVQLFDAWGPKDPNTVNGRRQLSSILFS